MKKKLTAIALLIITMILMTSCNLKDYLMLAAGDVNKDTVVLTPENIDDYIGLKVAEAHPEDVEIYGCPLSVCFENKRLEEGYAILECDTVPGEFTLYLPDTTMTIQEGVNIYGFFKGLSYFYSEWDAQYFADNTKVSEILSPLGDYSITVQYVSLDNPTVTIDYNADTNMRTLKFGMNRTECGYCIGNEF